VLEYRLFAADKQSKPERITHVRGVKIPDQVVNWQPRSSRPAEDLTAVDYTWLIEHPPLLARGMVLAGGTLFVAGPPDVADELGGFGRFREPQVRAELDDQVAALEGRKGALLWAVSAADGQKLAEYKLETPPVFDGIAAANGRLYLATVDGTVLCFAGR
jgi:outer membrane protein assembly factor BamB